MRTMTALFALATLAAPLNAQAARGGGRPAQTAATPDAAAIRRAIETITEADVRSRIERLAHDSMRGRNTPSPELEQAASWIASEFQRFGLRPAGDNGTFFQRYVIRSFTIDTSSTLGVEGRGAALRWNFGRDAAFLGALGGIPEGSASGPIVLVAGIPASTERPFGDVSVNGALVLFVPAGPGSFQALARAAQQGGARAFIVALAGQPFAGAARGTGRTRTEIGGGTAGLPVFGVTDSSTATLLRSASLTLDGLRSAGPSVRALAGITGSFTIRRNVVSEASAPNVIGLLEGSDPQLRSEYIVYSAHMDHVGVGRPVDGDSIYNGADDDASGTAGVMELAEAFGRLTPRPRRSMVFMTVSGEEHGLWGSEYYSENPTLPIASTVANLNLDMIGRNWRDTISVIGKEHSTLGRVAERISREHPELNMALVDDLWPNENFYFRSDHYNFARKGVPVLFFFNGTHADYHRPSDSADKIDAEKEMRILRMLFYIGLDVANTTERPQWNPESYRRIVGPQTP